MNVTPSLREELVMQPAVDDDDVTGAEHRRLLLDRHLDLALENEHHLLGVVVLVPRDLLARRVLNPAEQHLLAADRVQPHAVDEFPGVAAVPGAKRPRLRVLLRPRHRRMPRRRQPTPS